MYFPNLNPIKLTKPKIYNKSYDQLKIVDISIKTRD